MGTRQSQLAIQERRTMNPSRFRVCRRPSFVTLMWSLVLSSFVGSQLFAEPKDETKTSKKMPDISGNWLSESPLDSYVQDDSPQPVNSFRIERSKTADFEVHYLGSKAIGIPLTWNEDSKTFEGTAKNGFVTFVVTTTDDSDILKCNIGATHQDKWRRAKSSRVRDAAVQKPGETGKKPILRYNDDDEDLTDDLKKRTEAMMVDFYEYLETVGFKLQKGQCKLRTQRDMGNAHYYHNIRSIVIDPKYLTDDSILYREFTHHALAVTLGDDATEIFQSCSGVESALADYFGCSACEDPFVGRVWALANGAVVNGQQPYLRTMDNQKQFTELHPSSGRHAIGETMSGALWEIRDAIDMDTVDMLLLKAWAGIVKSDSSKGQVERFATSLHDVAGKENRDYHKRIEEIFERRGLKLPSAEK